MLKVFKKKRVYIIKYILNNLNKFILLSIMHIQSKLKITLSKIYENLQIQILRFTTDTFSENV